jgi:hypothetical protein
VSLKRKVKFERRPANSISAGQKIPGSKRDFSAIRVSETNSANESRMAFFNRLKEG